MVPKIDSDIGISVYSTNFKGIGGFIRNDNEDFQVLEILSKGALSKINQQEGFAIYKLIKTGIDTNHALSEIFRKNRVRLKALGLKDANAQTEQFVCSMNTSKKINDFSTNRYSLKFVGFLPKPLTKRDMVGNNFKIKIDGVQFREISKFNEQDKVLNFFGYQRFGSRRPVSHLIGKAILQNDFDEAVKLILSFSSDYDFPENIMIRKSLENNTNYLEMLVLLKPQMDIEKTILSEMAKHGNPIMAIRSLPLFIRRIFVQAFQSYVFNCVLSSAFEYGEDLAFPKVGDVCYDKENKLGKFENNTDQKLAIPIVGYAYKKNNRFDYYISKILEKERISARDFFSKKMQEISDEGGFRNSTIRCDQFVTPEPFVSFTLSRGSYATIFLREIMKPNDPIKAGF